MKSIAVFNNKGGVGKTTLAYHLACALAYMGKRVLMMDLDPQSNLTLFGLEIEELHSVWETEERFIDDYASSQRATPPTEFDALFRSPRSIHFLLKPTEDGTGEPETLPSPKRLSTNLDLLPGRLSIHMYENKLASRWNDAYSGDPLAIRTISRIRQLCVDYGEVGAYDYVIMDTSPSLGILNKVIISTADGFFVPSMPDMFSLYGIKNIGRALELWKRDFEVMHSLLSDEKRKQLPSSFVKFLGYTIFNAKKYSGQGNSWDLAHAHYNYARQIPDAIRNYIPPAARAGLTDAVLSQPIGGTAVMHTHNTLPNMAQKYRVPIWDVPTRPNLEDDDRTTIIGNRARYEATREAYVAFARDVMSRV